MILAVEGNYKHNAKIAQGRPSMTFLPLIVAACSIAGCGVTAPAYPLLKTVSTDQTAVHPATTVPYDHSQDNINAGNYLISRYAQQHHDWITAQKSMKAIVDSGINQDEILRRAMVLSMGAGDSDSSLKAAHKILDSKNSDNIAIAQLFVIAEALHNKNYEEASRLIKNTPDDSTSKFVSPYLKAWSQAAIGKLDISDLKENTLQIYHAILISDFLKDHTEIKKTLERATSVEDIHSDELMRIGDLYAHIGEKVKALELYKKALDLTPDDTTIAEHKTALEQGKNEPLFPPVHSVQEGLGRAFGDIAGALYQDYNDESAQIFANLSLYMQPDNNDITLLLAHIAARHEQYDEAIAFYKSLQPNDKNYTDAQYKIAELLIEAKRPNDAITILEKLVETTNDAEAQMRIGDILRGAENFGQALTAYDKAFELLGNKVPPEFWQLYYVRGMVQEQIGNWNEAEKDLKAALELQPDHPYILNYLGYAWADRGINLVKAEQMIARAAELRATDGYIIDSLGWVKYKTKNFKGATPVLEKAVALLPYDPTINEHLGDAYWQVGRQREAKFQWERAKNHSEDAALTKKLEDKLENGLRDEPAVAGVQD